MKQILVDSRNIVVDVVSKQFEVHESLKWYQVDNDSVQCGWSYVDGVLTDVEAEWEATDEGKRETMKTNRKLEYGSLPDQLDAIYRDLKDGTSKYVDHITAVKTKYPKVSAVDPIDKDTVTGE